MKIIKKREAKTLEKQLSIVSTIDASASQTPKKKRGRPAKDRNNNLVISSIEDSDCASACRSIFRNSKTLIESYPCIRTLLYLELTKFFDKDQAELAWNLIIMSSEVAKCPDRNKEQKKLEN
jgi:hypothetical protein